MGKRVGGIVPPVSDNPLLQAFYSARKLVKDSKSPRWQMASACASGQPMLVSKSPVTVATDRDAKGYGKTKRSRKVRR